MAVHALLIVLQLIDSRIEHVATVIDNMFTGNEHIASLFIELFRKWLARIDLPL